MPAKPEILHRQIVAQSRLFTIEKLGLRFSNGQQREFERVCGRASGAVLVVPLLDDQTILLVREYAAGMDQYVIAFPKGAVESSEELIDTANRELMEEVGYCAGHFTYMACLSTSPSYMTSKMHLILAQDLQPQRLVGDEPEDLEVISWSLSQVDELLSHPEFHEARSVAALLWLLRWQHVAR